MSLKHLEKFKIHSLDSLTGITRSANNNVFYNTYEDALKQVHSYMRHTPSADFVIMKTYAVFQHARAPITTHIFHDSGEIKEVL